MRPCGVPEKDFSGNPGVDRSREIPRDDFRGDVVYSNRLLRSIFSNLYAGNVVRRLSSTGPPTVKW